MKIAYYQKGARTARRSRMSGGYTLIELIVAVGLFAIVVTLATGAYLVMIGVQRQTQALATGINNLSFSFESMATAMRTGTNYCGGGLPCADNAATLTVFTFRDSGGGYVTYALTGTAIGVCRNPSSAGAYCYTYTALTESAVRVTSLTFRPSGTATGDTFQPYVRITVVGTVDVSPGKTQSFKLESSAVMRGTDL